MGVFVKQLLAGRDFANDDGFASQMANYVYLIGDDQTRECVVVDPAWDVAGILDEIDRQELRLVGALATHYHPDHVGGSLFGYRISGLAELQGLRPVKVYANEREAEGIKLVTGLSERDLVKVAGGDEIKIGDVALTFLHTPGHTPGSQCFLVGSALVSGDTLFIGGCGRVDLPGGDAEQMYVSLTQVLGKLPDDTVLYPGHNYAPVATSTIGRERATNPSMRRRRFAERSGTN
ncbi:MAG TPA: MBL fold metallo-hydrolase [Blastocatellia bacterium]|nr:MBL fold metallo-hydrolase [Blastocatellia bacterium]